MIGKQKRYAVEFKAKVAMGTLRGEMTTSQLATEHEDPFRGMSLLRQTNFVVLQEPADDADEPIQLQPLWRLAAAIAKWNRDPQHLGHRPKSGNNCETCFDCTFHRHHFTAYGYGHCGAPTIELGPGLERAMLARFVEGLAFPVQPCASGYVGIVRY